MIKQTTAETPKLSKVTLQKPHTHDGVDHPKGASIEVNDADKTWLITQEVIAAETAN